MSYPRQCKLDHVGEESNFFKYTSYSLHSFNECSFPNDELVNKHYYYYETENPQIFSAVEHQNRWRINIYADTVGDYVIVRYFFEERYNRYIFPVITS